MLFRLRRSATVSFAAMLLLAFAAAQTPTSPSLRIVSPKSGEKLSSTFVTVRFELMNPGATAEASPNYLVRLDGRDPVRTTDTEFTFSGMTSGMHTVIVELIDANGTPINGTRATVQFSITAQPIPTEAIPDHTDIIRQTSLHHAAHLVAAVFPQEMPEQNAPPAQATPARGKRAARRLPQTSTALPLLSVIGLGVLLGGLVSAMRTR
jgi:hypothetical protein